MFAVQLELKLKGLGIHYGWVIAFLAFLTTMFSSATLSVPQVLVLPLTESFGWKISDVTTSIAIMYFVLASIAPFGGAMMLRLGIPKVVAISVLFSIIGLIITVISFEKWHLALSIGICLGLASGILGLGLNATVATRWFVKKRGLVVGILTAAFAAGQLTFLPAMAWIVTNYDWRLALLPCLIGSALCGVLFLFFGKSWPVELNLPAYGDKEIYNPPEQPVDGAIYISFSALFEAIKHPTFWMLAGTFFICGLTSTGIVGQHFIPFCADNNVGIIAASSYLALMGIFNFIGTMSSGWLSDRFNNYKLLAAYYALRGVSLIFLPYSDFDVFALTLWAMFFGLDYIATVPPTVRLTSSTFGVIKGPVIFGWIFSAHQFGSAFAAYGVGLSRDSLLSYLPAFIVAGLFCFFAAIMILFFKYLMPQHHHLPSN
jgi:predicted MFS family arabinose efflux permease